MELKEGGRPPPASKMKCRRAILSEMGVHSGYNSFLLKQKENSGSVTATFRDISIFGPDQAIEATPLLRKANSS